MCAFHPVGQVANLAQAHEALAGDVEQLGSCCCGQFSAGYDKLGRWLLIQLAEEFLRLTCGDRNLWLFTVRQLSGDSAFETARAASSSSVSQVVGMVLEFDAGNMLSPWC